MSNSYCYDSNCIHNCCNTLGYCPVSSSSCYYFYSDSAQTKSQIVTNSEEKGLSGGSTAGIIVSCIIILLIVSLIIWFCCCRRRSRQWNTQAVPPSSPVQVVPQAVRDQPLSNRGMNDPQQPMYYPSQPHNQPIQVYSGTGQRVISDQVQQQNRNNFFNQARNERPGFSSQQMEPIPNPYIINSAFRRGNSP